MDPVKGAEGQREPTNIEQCGSKTPDRADAAKRGTHTFRCREVVLKLALMADMP